MTTAKAVAGKGYGFFKEKDLKKLNKEQEDKLTELFEQFWSINKKKVGKGAARDAWKKKFKQIDPENWNQFSEKIMREIKAQEQHRKRITDEFPDEYMRKKAGVFLPSRPNPSTWINQERWHDELPQQKEQETKAAHTCVHCKEKGKHHTQAGTLCDWHWVKTYDRPHLKMLYEGLEALGLGIKQGEDKKTWSDRCRAYLKTTAMGKAFGA